MYDRHIQLNVWRVERRFYYKPEISDKQNPPELLAHVVFYTQLFLGIVVKVVKALATYVLELWLWVGKGIRHVKIFSLNKSSSFKTNFWEIIAKLREISSP